MGFHFSQLKIRKTILYHALAYKNENKFHKTVLTHTIYSVYRISFSKIPNCDL